MPRSASGPWQAQRAALTRPRLPPHAALSALRRAYSHGSSALLARASARAMPAPPPTRPAFVRVCYAAERAGGAHEASRDVDADPPPCQSWEVPFEREWYDPEPDAGI